MSKEKRTIEIAPRLMSPGGRMTEVLESRGHACSYCQGNGYFGRRTYIGNGISKNAVFAKEVASLMRW